MPASPLTDPRADFPQWYQDLVVKADLAENGPVRGTMVIRPYGYAIWERIQAAIDQRIKAAGADNVYLPLLIPESYLRKEAEHVEGFSPELAVVTVAGGKELAEPLVVRPTSETVFGEVMSRWVQSYRDLPLLLNQWGNVVRWELRSRIFLRTSEFLWQEGHTAHAQEAEAAAYARRIHLDVYRDFLTRELGLSVFVGLKTVRERFAGAVATLTCEGIMRDGKALQLATSHELGQNFARAFGIEFTGEDGTVHTAYTTSWGSSTRIVGGLIMGHGDARGLRLPPSLAPFQVVVVVVRDGPGVADCAERLAAELRGRGVRVRLDDDLRTGFGRRVKDWELKGVPVRLELGPRDVEQGEVALARRDRGEKETVAIAAIPAQIEALLAEIQAGLETDHAAFTDATTHSVTSEADARDAAETGVVRIDWERLGPEGEARLAEHALTVRCLQRPDGTTPERADEPDLQAIVARAY